MQRREFLKVGVLAGAGVVLGVEPRLPAQEGEKKKAAAGRDPIVISTWDHGIAANKIAYQILMVSGKALDAVEKGVSISEADPKVTSVGYGGLPNADGVVQLDAAIMDGPTQGAGAVAGLEGIMHPISVARKVMETTPHILLVGEGAKRFALANGFKEENLLTPESKAEWEKWKAESGKAKEPKKNEAPAPHDTIGMVALDRGGNLAVACTTSGLPWKLPGRVGDSPLIGHGLYCEHGVGGATATGIGEEVIRVCGSYQVVEFMRQGRTPQEAIEEVLRRVLRRADNASKMIGFVALRADGEIGFASSKAGFQAAVSLGGKHDLKDAPSLAEKPGK